MLSDHAQERMRPLERPFRAEDPEFIRSFAMRVQWHLRREHGDSVSLTIGIVAAVLLGALLQPAGSSGGAPAFAAAVGLIWLVRRLPQSVSPLDGTVTNQLKPIADDPGRADPPSGSGQTDVDHETPEGKQ